MTASPRWGRFALLLLDLTAFFFFTKGLLRSTPPSPPKGGRVGIFTAAGNFDDLYICACVCVGVYACLCGF